MNITLGSTKLRAKLSKLEKSLPKQIDKALEIVASEGARSIEERALKGKGYLGNFAPYSPQYAKIRASKGRQFSHVNLTNTGQMWGAFSSTLEKRGVAKIHFLNPLANKKAYFNNKKRPFMGFSKSDKKKLLKFFESQIKL